MGRVVWGVCAWTLVVYRDSVRIIVFFFFNDTATTEIYTLSLHDALPIWKTVQDGVLP